MLRLIARWDYFVMAACSFWRGTRALACSSRLGPKAFSSASLAAAASAASLASLHTLRLVVSTLCVQLTSPTDCLTFF